MLDIIDLARILERAPDPEPILKHFVRNRKFPIVEGDQATFFFWDPLPVESVHLIHWVFALESRQPFQRIGDTNAFYLPLQLPHGARVEYKLEVQRGKHKALVRDPLNPRRALDPFGSNSVLPMEGYEEPAWTAPEPGVRHGRLETFQIDSEVWGDKREIQVYLPMEYKPHKRYPLMICHDGRDYQRFSDIVTVLDNLIHRHEVKPLIVAFTSGHSRNEEYAANPKQAKFIAEEVLPAVQARYPASDDPSEIGLMGASFGGVTSLFTAWQYPEKFGRLLLQSGSFLFTDVGSHGRGALWDPIAAFVNELRRHPERLQARVYMSCGTFESLIYYNRSLAPILRKGGLDVRFVEAQDGHNWIAWRDRLREGLTFLFPGHLWMYYE